MGLRSKLLRRNLPCLGGDSPIVEPWGDKGKEGRYPKKDNWEDVFYEYLNCLLMFMSKVIT